MEVHKFVDEHLKRGTIRESWSPYAANFFFVKKKDGKLRPVQDYRPLNKWTIKNQNVSPLIPATIDRLSGCTLFTKFDVRWGYNNIRIKPGDEWKAAFLTPEGLFEPRVMFFGLTNSPATFQMMMNTIFRKEVAEGWLSVYMDDIAIHSKKRPMETEEQHRQRHKLYVHHVLNKLEKHDLYLKPEKCAFEKDEIDYLGVIIGKGIVKMDPSKLKGVADWPRPKTPTEIRQFLGFTGYYRYFIPKYSEIARPLLDLTKKDIVWKWENRQQRAFEELKQRMCRGPVLQQPDFGKKFYLQADASLYGVGAVLSQEGKHLTPSLAKQQKPILHPIAYYSATFTQTERNYDIYERELLAVMKALAHWRQYLGWTKEPFVIMTDHANLQYWKSPKNLNRRTARWQADLQEYDYEIRHIPGKDNIPPDALSRPPGVDQGKNDNQQQVVIPPEKYKAAMTTLEQPMTTEMKRAIMLLVHDHPAAGHPGRDETIRKARMMTKWDGMNDWIAEYIQGCAICQQNKIQTHKAKTPPFRIDTTNDALPFQRVAMDLITGLPMHKGKDAILTIVDQGCSRAAVFLPCTTNITGEGIAQLYMDHVYKWYGLPTKIISDRDPRFTSHFGKSLARRLGIKQNLSTAFHPQTDGLSERKNQWVEQYLRLVTSTSPEAWTDWISIATAIHNNRRNATTKLSPNQILLGYETKLIPTGTGESTNEATERRLETMMEKRLAAIDAINQMAKIRAPIPSQYKIGNQVWLEATHLKLRHQKTKLAPKRYGPFKIIKEISPVAYKIQLPVSWGIHDVFHASLLSPYTETAAHGPNFSRPPPDLIDGEEEYEVERIVNHRRHGRARRLEYLIKWKGYPESDNTWEPADQVHAPELIKLYHRHSPLNNIKGRRVWSQVQCPPGLIYPPLLGVAKKAGPRLLQPSSILPRPAPASPPLSSTPNRQTANRRPESRPPYSNSSPAQSSPNPKSLYDLSTPKTSINFYSDSKTSYLSKPTTSTPSYTGSTADSTTAPITTTPDVITNQCPSIRPCPSSRPRRVLLGSTRPMYTSRPTSLKPLWLKRRPSPFPHVPHKHVPTNLTGSLLTCLGESSEASWPPSTREASNNLRRRTSSEPVSKSLKTASKRSLKYPTTYTRLQKVSTQTTNDGRPMPASPTKRASLWRQNGSNTSKTDASPPMPWAPLSTRCHTSSISSPNPLLTMRTNPSNRCPTGSALPYTPTTSTGKYYTKKSTKWRIGASLRKSNGIGTFIGSSMTWRRKSSLCRWTSKALDNLQSCVSIGSKRPEPINTPSTVKDSLGTNSASRDTTSMRFTLCANKHAPTTTTTTKQQIRVRVVRSSRGRLEV